MKIQIYTTTYCPYCVRAKQLLQKRGLAYTEIDVTGDDAARLALVEKSGGRKTVPQIFIDDVCIGGCDDLYALDAAGKLAVA
jgi:glutaredoxin 3